MSGSSPQGGPGKEKRFLVAERRRQAIAMRCAGATWQDVADALDYSSRQAAHKDISTAFEQERKQMSEGLEELRQLELARLDTLIAKATEILVADHPYLFGGEVVPGVSNSGPVLAAVDKLKALSESRRKLLGLDAQPEQGGGGTVQFYVNGVDMGKLA
jgi:hypothetical protein